MLLIGPSTVDLTTLFHRAINEVPSYREVGATAEAVLPRRYRHDRHEVRIGDCQVFERATTGLRRWAAHEGASIQIFPQDAPVSAGTTILATLSFGPAHIVAPCRILRVVDDPNRFGFAYGTLPGHPERGEEFFVVERRPEGTFFTITAFSRPAGVLPWLAAPLGRAIQLAVTRQCIQALARYVQAGR